IIQRNVNGSPSLPLFKKAMYLGCTGAGQEVNMPDSGDAAAHSEDGDGKASPGRPPTGAALVVAVIVTAVWLGLLIWLFVDVGASDVEWSRQLVVFGSLEAVAFAVLGALFGTTVQRYRITDLAMQRDAARSLADANQAAALNGQKLAV